MGLAYPFQGTICFKKEATYAAGGTGTGLVVSDKVYDAKIGFGDTFKALRGISAPSVCAFVSAPFDYTFHLEWVEQQHTSSIVTCCITRTSAGDLPSVCFDLGVNVKGGTKSYYYIKGAKCKSINRKANTGNEFILTAEFSCASVIVSAAPVLTLPVALATAYGVFNKAGVIVKKGTITAIATIVDGFDVTIDNGLTDYWNADSQYKQASIPGELNVTGTVDISLDDGGGAFATALYTDLTNIYIDTGLTNSAKWTLTGARWDGLDIDVNTSNDIVKTGAKFRAKIATIS